MTPFDEMSGSAVGNEKIGVVAEAEPVRVDLGHARFAPDGAQADLEPVHLQANARGIEHWNVTEHPTAPWVWHQVIAATAWSRTPRFWLRDRDTSYGDEFVAKAARIGIRTVLTPARAPQANAIAERVIRTLRRECLDHVIVRDEQHLRRVLSEYVQFHNDARPYRSQGLEPPNGAKPVGSGRIVVEPVLGGLHHVYRRAA